MKKLLKTILLLLVICFLALYFYFYYFEKPVQSLKKNFFLLFREKITVSQFMKNPFSPFTMKLKGIYSNHFFTGDVTCNFLTKTLSLNNIIIDGDFTKKLKSITKDIEYLQLPVKRIELSHLTVSLEKNFSLTNAHGVIYIDKNITFQIYGYYRKMFLKIYGNLNNGSKISITTEFNNIKLKNIAKLINVNFPQQLPNVSAKGKIISTGYMDNLKHKDISLNIKDYIINFSIVKNVDSSVISNGKIALDENNTISFSGELINDKNFTLGFHTESPISGKIDNITFEDVKFSFNYNRVPERKKFTISINGDTVGVPSYNYIKYLISNNVNSNIYLNKLTIDNSSLTQVNINTNFANKQININKLNFGIDNGKFIFSLIHKGNTFQSALEVKHIDIARLLRISHENSSFGGLLNVTFIGEGTDNNFKDAKGYFFIENFYLNGISPDNLTTQLQQNNLVNLKLFNIDNSTLSQGKLSFEMMKGFIKGESHYLTFPKIVTTDSSTYFNIYGKVDINNIDNIMLNGIYSDERFSKNIIVNISLKNNLLQIVGKNE